MKIQRVVLGIATIFLIAGLSTQYIQAHQSVPYHETQVAKTVLQSTPVKITIPAVAIDAQVKPGGIVNGQWILSDTFVHFITLDQKANKTLLYGHEREGLFVNLKHINKNDKIEIFDKNGKMTTYEVYSIDHVKPTDINKLYGDANTITLYTCDGAFDQLRLLVKAKLIK